MLTDVLNEGYYDKFNLDIIDLLKIKDIQLIFWRYKFKDPDTKILKIKNLQQLELVIF